jgi:hypothetical protein
VSGQQYVFAKAAYLAYAESSPEDRDLKLGRDERPFEKLPYEQQRRWLAVAQAVAETLTDILRGL